MTATSGISHDLRIADYERAYQYALHLADTLHERHYPANTGWRPLGDLPGLLTQIDNMIAGFGPTQVIRDKALDEACARADKAEAERDALRAALDSIANNTCCEGCQEAALVARQALKGTNHD